MVDSSRNESRKAFIAFESSDAAGEAAGWAVDCMRKD